MLTINLQEFINGTTCQTIMDAVRKRMGGSRFHAQTLKPNMTAIESAAKSESSQALRFSTIIATTLSTISSLFFVKLLLVGFVEWQYRRIKVSIWHFEVLMTKLNLLFFCFMFELPPIGWWVTYGDCKPDSTTNNFHNSSAFFFKAGVMPYVVVHEFHELRHLWRARKAEQERQRHEMPILGSTTRALAANIRDDIEADLFAGRELKPRRRRTDAWS